MTAIIALTNGKNVWMAGDSFCGDEDKKDLCKTSKVYKVGPIGIGLCGMVRQELIVEKTIRRLIEEENVKVTHDWLKFELPDILVAEMRERHATVDKENQATLGDSAYMIAFGGKIYYLDDDFGIWDSQRKFAAIGSGKQYALGAMAALDKISSELSPEDKVRLCLDCAHDWSIYVCPPYTCIKV